MKRAASTAQLTCLRKYYRPNLTPDSHHDYVVCRSHERQLMQRLHGPAAILPEKHHTFSVTTPTPIILSPHAYREPSVTLPEPLTHACTHTRCGYHRIHDFHKRRHPPLGLAYSKILSALQGFQSIARIHRSQATLMRLETKVLTDPHQVSNPVRMNIAKRTLKRSTQAGPSAHPRHNLPGRRSALGLGICVDQGHGN
jgi:hypothetical protein